MSERGNQLAIKSERSYAALIAFLSDLTAADLRLPCDDPVGDTVGAVIGHLAEGAEATMTWGATILHGTPGTGGEAAAEHGHGHGHGHVVVADAAALDDAVALFNRVGTAAVSLLRFLTDEQLDTVPAAAPGLSDGKMNLAEVIGDMMDHQDEHLNYLKAALARKADVARETA
jgi:hypothetical protein